MFSCPTSCFRHPQDVVFPETILLPETTQSFPQSQVQFQVIAPSLSLPDSLTTRSRPNRFPARSRPIAWRSRSIRKQPQLSVCPVTTNVARNLVSFPQSHTNNHTGLFLPSTPSRLIAVSRPNFSPAILCVMSASAPWLSSPVARPSSWSGQPPRPGPTPSALHPG